MDCKSTIYASFDGMKLSGCIWEPAETKKAVINLIHGYNDHIERFEHWAKYFIDKGYIVHAIDYRGHGKSDGKRGHINSFDDLLNDIELLLKESNKLYPDLPQFLYGQSLGGNMVTNYILKRDNNLKGAIISSPWYKLSFSPPKFLLFLAKIMNKVYPKFTQKSNLDAFALTQDKKIVDAYINDPLLHGKISPRMLTEIIKAGQWVLGNAKKIDIPILLQHGNGDKVTSYKASSEFYLKAKEAGNDIVFKEWQGLYHELHNEPEKEKVFEFVYNWIENKLNANS